MLQVVCVTPPTLFTQREKIPIFHLSIWSVPRDRRFPPHPHPSACGPKGQIRSACCVLWKALGFIQWLLFGGIYSVSPSISSSDEATFSSLSLAPSLYPCFFLHHSFWNASCFSDRRCLILFASVVVSFIRKVLLALLKGETQNPRWEMLSSSFLLITVSLPLMFILHILHSLIVLWLCNS